MPRRTPRVWLTKVRRPSTVKKKQAHSEITQSYPHLRILHDDLPRITENSCGIEVSFTNTPIEKRFEKRNCDRRLLGSSGTYYMQLNMGLRKRMKSFVLLCPDWPWFYVLYMYVLQLLQVLSALLMSLTLKGKNLQCTYIMHETIPTCTYIRTSTSSRLKASP